ncbi:LysR family transcriptional regulator [Sphingomonas sp. PP-CC-3A-396]|uniref:LysR family transcriptional regulator n=1 Tax=Sphingomonas sp. PP-CC-3A-396 TaxID=2135655 RepID=UPI00104E963F|nr:LysR family transcriptional regulator [Sphingomonas sp. PP-CC-3A-396]TCQ03178.1 LysR family transcriptional regulator [Sphingomonas sp. PP-CC-3A-396]
MQLDWLEDFLTLAEERNFSRAAQRRNITQPAFGRRIRSLEQWVGAALFTRTTAGTTLSPAGEMFRGYIQVSVRDLYRARAAAMEVVDQAASVLTVAATHALSFTFFPHWIVEHAPHEPINLKSDSMQACERIMQRGEASFLLSHHHPLLPTSLDTPDFLRVEVGEDLLVPLCQPDDTGAPRWTLDSPEVPYLAYSSESGLGGILKADWEARSLAPRLEMVLQSRLAAALLSMAIDGRGVAWVPLSLAQSALGSGKVVLAADDVYSTKIAIALVRPAISLSKVSEALWASACEPAGSKGGLHRPPLPHHP